jgi:formylglycine-generating enzyme required for sulfatase activity
LERTLFTTGNSEGLDVDRPEYVLIFIRPAHHIWGVLCGSAVRAAGSPEDHDSVFYTANHPRVGVSWYEAAAFCIWLRREINRTAQLPSEADWERAPRRSDGYALDAPGITTIDGSSSAYNYDRIGKKFSGKPQPSPIPTQSPDCPLAISAK